MAEPLESRESLLLAVSQLREELEEAQNNLYKAAECGNTLLSTNQMLNDKLESREKEYTERLEELEQENYSLKMKMECQQSSSSSLQQELEHTLAQLKKERASCEKRLEEVHSKKVQELTLLQEDLKAEIARLSVQAKGYQERIGKQEEIIGQLREEASCRGDASVLHNELKDLGNLYSTEKARSEGLELDLLEANGQLKVAMMEICSLQQKCSGLEEECLERNKMAKEWYDALQASNDRNAELSAQLELATSKDSRRGDHAKTSGNSLFGEVDDRRMDVEKKMISLKVKYESMERSYSTTKQQLRKMKAEMSALLCQYTASTADAAQVQRLQRALSQSKSEIQVLTGKLHRMEQLQAEGAGLQDVKQYVSAFVDLGDKAEYVHFLEGELEQQKVSYAAMVKELDLNRTQLLWETNKLSEAEARLHQSQREQAKLKKDQTKLHMRNQETEEKLQQIQIHNKQLEAERKYLEDELKQRGAGKRPSGSNQQSHSPLRTLTVAGTENQTSSVLNDEPKLALPAPSHREINILEDLEKENLFKTPSHSGPEKGHQSTEQDVIDLSMVGLEKCPTSRNAAKVIHVSKDSVNKCPQQ